MYVSFLVVSSNIHSIAHFSRGFDAELRIKRIRHGNDL